MNVPLILWDSCRWSHVEGDPWNVWTHHVRVESDPNPMPRFRIWRWW